MSEPVLIFEPVEVSEQFVVVGHTAEVPADHPDRRPVFTKAYLHLIDHQKMGIPREGSVPSMVLSDHRRAKSDEARQFPTGWYIIDNESLLCESGDYQFLNSRRADDYIGYGFRVYKIDDAVAEELEQLQLQLQMWADGKR